MMQLVTVEVALPASAPALQVGIETALARWDFCSAWIVTDVDVQRQTVELNSAGQSPTLLSLTPLLLAPLRLQAL